MKTIMLRNPQTITWNEVCRSWEAQEANWGWNTVWMKKGFASWIDWRMTYVSALDLQRRDWQLFDVAFPKIALPSMWAGGFEGWKQYLPPEMSFPITMKSIANHPELFNNPKVQGILSHPPKATTIIGVRWQSDIVIVDGMHRAAAVSLAAKRSIRIPTRFRIALTRFVLHEEKLFNQARTHMIGE